MWLGNNQEYGKSFGHHGENREVLARFFLFDTFPIGDTVTKLIVYLQLISYLSTFLFNKKTLRRLLTMLMPGLASLTIVSAAWCSAFSGEIITFLSLDRDGGTTRDMDMMTSVAIGNVQWSSFIFTKQTIKQAPPAQLLFGKNVRWNSLVFRNYFPRLGENFCCAIRGLWIPSSPSTLLSVYLSLSIGKITGEYRRTKDFFPAKNCRLLGYPVPILFPSPFLPTPISPIYFSSPPTTVIILYNTIFQFSFPINKPTLFNLPFYRLLSSWKIDEYILCTRNLPPHNKLIYLYKYSYCTHTNKNCLLQQEFLPELGFDSSSGCIMVPSYLFGLCASGRQPYTQVQAPKLSCNPLNISAIVGSQERTFFASNILRSLSSIACCLPTRLDKPIMSYPIPSVLMACISTGKLFFRITNSINRYNSESCDNKYTKIRSEAGLDRALFGKLYNNFFLTKHGVSKQHPKSSVLVTLDMQLVGHFQTKTNYVITKTCTNKKPRRKNLNTAICTFPHYQFWRKFLIRAVTNLSVRTAGLRYFRRNKCCVVTMKKNILPINMLHRCYTTETRPQTPFFPSAPINPTLPLEFLLALPFSLIAITNTKNKYHFCPQPRSLQWAVQLTCCSVGAYFLNRVAAVYLLGKSSHFILISSLISDIFVNLFQNLPNCNSILHSGGGLLNSCKSIFLASNLSMEWGILSLILTPLIWGTGGNILSPTYVHHHIPFLIQQPFIAHLHPFQCTHPPSISQAYLFRKVGYATNNVTNSNTNKTIWGKIRSGLIAI